MRVFLPTLLIMALWPMPSGSAAGGMHPGFYDVTVVGGLSAPTAMAFAPDGRLFVAQQTGRTARHQERRAPPHAVCHADRELRPANADCSASPSIRTSPPTSIVYVFYTATTPAIHNRISRFKANGDVADTTESEVVLLDFDNLTGASNHNGGAIHFGLDGKLYAAHGENAVTRNSQTPEQPARARSSG